MPAKGIRAWRCCAVRRQGLLLQAGVLRVVGIGFEVGMASRSIETTARLKRQLQAEQQSVAVVYDQSALFSL